MSFFGDDPVVLLPPNLWIHPSEDTPVSPSPLARPLLETEDRHRSAIATAQSYIELHFNCPLPLSRLARQVYISPFHFSRIFKHYAGVTPHQYLLQIRLHKAATLLHESSLPVTDVCYQAGFSRPDYFAYAFRKQYHSTPTQYRLKTTGRTSP